MEKVINFLLDAVFADLIFQPTEGIVAPDNMLIINFRKHNDLLSIHSCSFLKISLDNSILVCSTDEYVDENYALLSDHNADFSIMNLNINKTKRVLINHKVTFASIDDGGDLMVVFSNGAVLKIFTDCLIEGYEYYRILSYKKLEPLILVECQKEKVVVISREEKD